MSQEPPPDDKDSKALTATEKDEEAVEALLERVPQNLIRETLIGIIREGASPRIDPETYKLAAQTAQQEQDNKLTFLMRKLEVEDAQNDRQHKLDVSKHNLEIEQSRSLFKMCWPILLAAILVIVGGIPLEFTSPQMARKPSDFLFSLLPSRLCSPISAD